MTEEEGAPLDIKFQQRFSKNLISNVVYFVLNVIIGLALVPFFLDTLGEAAYGLIPLATSLTSYVTLVIDAVNGAIARYLTIDLQRGDTTKANETFNTAVFGTLGIILILVPISIIVAGLAPSIFDIGTESPTAVFLIFALVFGSILIRAWSSNFMVTLFAYNRLDLRNYVNITNILVQLILVIILFICINPSLPFVGLSYFFASFISLVFAYGLSKWLCPFLTIKPSAFSKLRMREILGIAGWTTITKLGLVLKGQVALMIVNIMFGAIAGTQYSLALLWSSLLIGIISMVTNCFTPMIYSYRARDDKHGMKKFVAFSVKITTLITALLIGLVCIFAAQLLKIWVGEEYMFLASLVMVIIIPVIFSVQSSCCAPVNAAYVKVRLPAIANIFGGGLTIILALTLPNIFGIEMYGVALGVGISTCLISCFISPIYGAYILNTRLSTFLKPAVPGYIALVILILFGILLNNLFSIDTLFEVLLAGGIITIVYFLIIFKILLTKNERILIRSCIPSYIAKVIPQWLL